MKNYEVGKSRKNQPKNQNNSKSKLFYDNLHLICFHDCFFLLSDDEPKAHFIRPESYQVTWWPGDHPEDDIQSDSTSGMFQRLKLDKKIMELSLSAKVLGDEVAVKSH